AAFLRLHTVDFERLRKNIRDCLQTRVQISLPELLDLCPPRNGVLELLAYLLIADSDGPHVVLESLDLIKLPGEARSFRVPQIIFSNTRIQLRPNPSLLLLSRFGYCKTQFTRKILNCG